MTLGLWFSVVSLMVAAIVLGMAWGLRCQAVRILRESERLRKDARAMLDEFRDHIS